MSRTFLTSPVLRGPGPRPGLSRCRPPGPARLCNGWRRGHGTARTTGPGTAASPRELVAWSNLSGSRLLLLHPVDDLNILGALTAHGFSPAGAPLPQAPGHQELESALRTASQVAW